MKNLFLAAFLSLSLLGCGGGGGDTPRPHDNYEAVITAQLPAYAPYIFFNLRDMVTYYCGQFKSPKLNNNAEYWFYYNGTILEYGPKKPTKCPV